VRVSPEKRSGPISGVFTIQTHSIRLLVGIQLGDNIFINTQDLLPVRRPNMEDAPGPPFDLHSPKHMCVHDTQMGQWSQANEAHELFGLVQVLILHLSIACGHYEAIKQCSPPFIEQSLHGAPHNTTQSQTAGPKSVIMLMPAQTTGRPVQF